MSARIVVGMDGSGSGDRVIEFAKGLAAHLRGDRQDYIWVSNSSLGDECQRTRNRYQVRREP